MLDRPDAERPPARVIPLAGFVVLLWLVETFDQLVRDGALDAAGILPRDLRGLDGILWAPLLHGGFGHLMANTLPLIVLGLLVALQGPGRWLFVTAFIAVAGGLGTWLFARPAVHIGASIIVFGYITYLISVGFFERRLLGIAVGITILFVYGGTLLTGIFPVQSGVSWEGHLFGALAGFGAAWLVGRSRQTAPN